MKTTKILRKLAVARVEPLRAAPMPLFVAPRPQGLSSEKFAAYNPVDRIKAVYDVHGEKAVQLASMQKTAGVIMHLIARAEVDIPILFFDTQLLHQETHDLKKQFEERYGLDIRTITPNITPEQMAEKYGPELWMTKEGQKKCCELRKEEPLLETMKELDVQATFSGLMRTEGGARGHIEPVSADPRLNTTSYHPLYDMTNKDIHAYHKEHDLPVHALYAKNFLSIGCAPCTTAVKPGEDARAGRWRHLRKEGESTKAYCGMNYTDVNPSKDGAKKKRKPLFARKAKKQA